jgi:hypothetical protein
LSLALDTQSQKEKLPTDVEVLLPDPNDPRLIDLYQRILVSLGEKPDGNRNPLLANVLATSIACAIVAANNNYIRVKLYYSKFLPAFRVDLSGNGAVVTQDDPAKSALYFEPQSEFYEMLRATIRNEMAVSTEAKWNKELFVWRTFDAKCCDDDALNAFGIAITNIKEIRREVAKLITERTDRYK